MGEIGIGGEGLGGVSVITAKLTRETHPSRLLINQIRGFKHLIRILVTLEAQVRKRSCKSENFLKKIG